MKKKKKTTKVYTKTDKGIGGGTKNPKPKNVKK